MEDCPRDPSMGLLMMALFLVLCLVWAGLCLRVMMVAHLATPHLAAGAGLLALVAALSAPFSAVNVVLLLWRGRRCWRKVWLDAANGVVVVSGGLAMILRLPLDDPESVGVMYASLGIAGTSMLLRLICRRDNPPRHQAHPLLDSPHIGEHMLQHHDKQRGRQGPPGGQQCLG